MLFPVHPLTLARYRAAFPPAEPKMTPPMPNANSHSYLPTATSSSPSIPRAPRCAPWPTASNTAAAWSATPSGYPALDADPEKLFAAGAPLVSRARYGDLW